MVDHQKIKKYYDKGYFEIRDHISPPLVSALEIFMKERNLKKVLDVGCGTGQAIKFLNDHGFSGQGCDISKIAVDKANKLNKKNVAKIASADNLPYQSNNFDLVIALSVIEHLSAKITKKFLQEAYRVLKKNGYIFIVTPNFSTPIRYLQGSHWFGYSDPTHLNFYTPHSLASLLKKEQFKKIKLYFRVDSNVSFDWELPINLNKLPKFIRSSIVFLLFSTPFSLIRNSFWIAAQKKTIDN
ncbi:class I SAM-dependent methyltransferase [Candidatus Curtissbacteria bacterium]|nr:class I SAM-dependent methyltransferase [Candidatus Curtissbacteria bacterium]